MDSPTRAATQAPRRRERPTFGGVGATTLVLLELELESLEALEEELSRLARPRPYAPPLTSWNLSRARLRVRRALLSYREHLRELRESNPSEAKAAHPHQETGR